MIEYNKIASVESQVFPFIEGYGDYHEISIELDGLKKRFQTTGTVIMGREIAFDGNYWAIFWIRGERPTNKEIRQLLLDDDFFDADCDHAEINI